MATRGSCGIRSDTSGNGFGWNPIGGWESFSGFNIFEQWAGENRMRSNKTDNPDALASGLSTASTVLTAAASGGQDVRWPGRVGDRSGRFGEGQSGSLAVEEPT
jgi:hypothetical protein